MRSIFVSESSESGKLHVLGSCLGCKCLIKSQFIEGQPQELTCCPLCWKTGWNKCKLLLLGWILEWQCSPCRSNTAFFFNRNPCESSLAERLSIVASPFLETKGRPGFLWHCWQSAIRTHGYTVGVQAAKRLHECQTHSLWTSITARNVQSVCPEVNCLRLQGYPIYIPAPGKMNRPK